MNCGHEEITAAIEQRLIESVGEAMGDSRDGEFFLATIETHIRVLVAMIAEAYSLSPELEDEAIDTMIGSLKCVLVREGGRRRRILNDVQRAAENAPAQDG